MHDAEFFRELVRVRNLPQFEILSCGYASGVTNRRDGIGHLTGALDALPTIAGFQNVEAILITADNDDLAATNSAFQRVQDYIAKAELLPGQPYPVPDQPLVKKSSNPTMVVMMLPWTGVAGALDSLCFTAAAAKRPLIAPHVQTLAASCGVNGWPVTKQAKMKLRSLISAAYMSDPYLAPAWVWRDGTDLVPLTDSAFDQIASFLNGFPALLATP